MKEQIKTISILVIFAAAFLGAVVWISRLSNNAAPAAIETNYNGTLTLKETSYDFGDVSMKNGLVSHEFTLENKSNSPVKIGEVSTSCMCTTAELKVNDKIAGPFGMPGHGLVKKANLIVAAGESLVVKAIFNPAAHGPAGVGPIERQVSLSVGESEPLILDFKANVLP